ncbi:hypothetical protein N656DRAFT_773184 [Canariomyces notabilis]|jgi:hypothetical protein|uniref:Uncharacterized protein n=1 Tax=Canariomyces notabilis TaxID=2074819 RepID=A0AAN6YXA1_9PEZI|nr:hypothetical protein N656DRAFT_773184 [Canariomyces arenarius]
MGEIDKPAVTQAESVSGKPRRRGCAGHCARFWWAYLIALACIVVLVVPLVLLVGIPNLAQQKLDAAVLSIDGIVVTNTQAQNMTMAINSTIRSDGQVHATFEPFQGVMYLEDLQPHTPFAKIDFPETDSDALVLINVTQTLQIENVEALTVFNTWLLANESLKVTVEGNTNVHVRGISRAYPVTFKKTVDIPGLRMLQGIIVNQTFINATATEGDNFRGQVYIPNHSVVAFELGNCTFHNYLLGKEVGTVFIDNMTLWPGMNNYTMRASISQSDVINVMGQRPYCDEAKGVLPFEIGGKSVVNHGQALPYFANALASANQTITIDIGGTLKRDYDLTIPCAGES